MLAEPIEILNNLQKCSSLLDQPLDCRCEKYNQHEQLVQSLKMKKSDFKTYSSLYQHFLNPKCCLMMHLLAYHKTIQKILMYFKRKERNNEEGLLSSEKKYRELQRIKKENPKHLKCCESISKQIPIYYSLHQKNHLSEQNIKFVLELVQLNQEYSCIMVQRLNNSLQQPLDVQIIIKDLIFLLNTGGGGLLNLYYDKKKSSIIIPTLNVVNSRLRAIFNQRVANCNRQNLKFDQYFRIIDYSRFGMFLIKIKVPEKQKAIYLMKEKQYIQKEAIWIQSLNNIGDRQKIEPFQMYRYIQKAALSQKKASINANINIFSPYCNSLSSNFVDIFSIQGLYFYLISGNYNPLDFQQEIKTELELENYIFFNFSKLYRFKIKESQIHKSLLASTKNLNIHSEKTLQFKKQKAIDFTVMKATKNIQIHLDNSNVNLTPIVQSIMDYKEISKQHFEFSYQIQPRGHQKTIVKIQFTKLQHALMILANYSSTKPYQARARKCTFYQEIHNQSLNMHT